MNGNASARLEIRNRLCAAAPAAALFVTVVVVDTVHGPWGQSGAAGLRLATLVSRETTRRLQMRPVHVVPRVVHLGLRN